MNSNTENPISGNGAFSAACNAEETLRLLAALPAPEGLEDRIHNRIHAVLSSAPHRGRVLAWPARAVAAGWMRAVAAAAIAFVVTGGGWGVYSRVQQGQPATGIAMPRLAAPGGFAGAGAMRTPQTLNGPVLTRPPMVHPLPGKTAKKPAVPASGAAAASGKTAVQHPASSN
jgi:hypothetical protein